MAKSRWNEVRELTRIRVLLFWREPEVVFWVFLFPVVLALVLGFAFRESEPEQSRVLVFESDRVSEPAEKLAAAEDLEIEYVDESSEAARRLRRGRVDVVLEWEEVDGARTPKLAFDPKRAEAVLAKLRCERALASQAEASPVPSRPIEERGSRYIDFLFAGLLGMNLMGTGIWGVSFAIADMRQKKLLRRMIVTPMRRSSFLLSLLLFRMIFLIAEVVVLLSFGLWLLDVPVKGSMLALAGLSVLGGLAFAGLGLLIASRAQTIEGVSGLTNFAMMPMWLASGVFFSYERFPEFLHPILRLIPLTALNDALRNVMLDGGGFMEQGPEILVLVAWGLICFFGALKIFRWS